ncbi:MAG: hypothetical protein RLZZ179_2166 [Verrucomicrobiota bacterium]
MASTGPRLLGRGDSLVCAILHTRFELLQRGRAFWGAEIRRMESGFLVRPNASTGPRLLGRGDPAQDVERYADHRASTGPRLLGRGDPENVGVHRSRCHASTGPRLLGRGDGIGHPRGGRGAACFNGAAPFGARRCGAIPDGAGRPVRASTGPRLLGRGDSACSSTRQPPDRGFNGAAPFGARRSSELLIMQRARAELQRGRAFWGAEIRQRICGSKCTESGLQRGRAFWGAEMRQQEIEDGKKLAASTGPRLLGRGDAIWGRITPDNFRASTGPRLLGRGDPRIP